MAKVVYDGNLIQPVQTVTIEKQFQKDNTGNILGKVYSIVINGTFVTHKGSPRSDGSFHTGAGYPADENIVFESRLPTIMKKQQALTNLFSTQGLTLEILGLDATQPFTCNPRVNSIQFQEGPWIDTCRFTINLEADEIYPSEDDVFTDYISSASESWTLETDDQPEGLNLPRTYRLTHTVGAVGKRFFESDGSLSKEPWKQAQSYVLPRLGFDSVIALSSGVNNLPSYYGGYNHVRSESIDESQGEFSVTESWILTSGTALEDFTVQTNYGQDGQKRATIEGNITGLEQRDSNLNLTTSKYTNALNKFSTVSALLHNRAQTYSGFTLNATPLSYTTSRNPINGTISYNYEYDDRFAFQVDDTVAESITITKSWEADLFATIPIIGRDKGHYLQDLSSYQPVEVSLNIELVFDSDYFPSGSTITQRINTYNPRVRSPYTSQIQDIIDAANPIGHTLNNLGDLCTRAFVQSQNDNWSINERRYSIAITWVTE